MQAPVKHGLSKAALRRQSKQVRAQVPPVQLKNFSQKIQSLVLNYPPVQLAKHIFCYVSTPTEVRTHDLILDLLALDKKVSVPVIKQKPSAHQAGIMRPAWLDPTLFNHEQGLSRLTPNQYQILEPATPHFTQESIQVSLMPALAVTKQGHRLGYGGGFYDRFIDTFQPELNVVLALEQQIIDFIPQNKFDRVVDVIVTPKQIIQV
jgi:5-formyltetrahydrofolate cyclo-ligase